MRLLASWLLDSESRCLAERSQDEDRRTQRSFAPRTAGAAVPTFTTCGRRLMFYRPGETSIVSPVWSLASWPFIKRRKVTAAAAAT